MSRRGHGAEGHLAASRCRSLDLARRVTSRCHNGRSRLDAEACLAVSQPSSLRRSLHQSHPYACLCSGGTRDVGGDDGGADSLSPLPRAGQCVERAAALSGRLLGPPDERDVPPMHPIGAAQDPLFSAGHHLRSPPSPPPTNLGFAPRHPAQQLMNKLYQRSLSQERDQRQMMRDWADGVRQQHERIVPSARKMPMNFLAT